jgi:hypothetical protein
LLFECNEEIKKLLFFKLENQKLEFIKEFEGEMDFDCQNGFGKIKNTELMVNLYESELICKLEQST